MRVTTGRGEPEENYGSCLPPQSNTGRSTRKTSTGGCRHAWTEQMLILGESHPRAVLIEYQMHYSVVQPHRDIAQSVPDELHTPSATVVGLDTEQIHRRSVLNSLIEE